MSPMAFSYAGIHAEAMRHAREWFAKPDWPPYAAWWVDRGKTTNWAEAVARHEYLHDHGPSVYAFDFKSPFDEFGNPATIDREALKRLICVNKERQSRLS